MKALRLIPLMCLLLPAAQAGVWEGFIEDGPHLGIVTSGDVEDPTVAFGWQVEANLNEYVAAELAYSRFEDDFTREQWAELGVPGGARGGIDANTFTFTLRANVWENERVRLFGGGGVGWYPINDRVKRVDESGLTALTVDIEQEFGYHLATGFEVFINENWEVLFEARWAFVENDVTIDAVRDTGRFLDTEKINSKLEYDHVLLRLGINYRF